MEIPYVNFSGHTGVLEKNYPHSVSCFYSWLGISLISQSDDLIIIAIDMKN